MENDGARNMSGLILDLLLVVALLWSAVRTLTSPDLFRAVVLFIVFSLLMALAWARLNAPDIALAEAAIGAGNQVLGLEFLNFFILRRGAEGFAPAVAGIDLELEIGEVEGIGRK